MKQEYNLVIVTESDFPVASIKINLPIVLPIGSKIGLTDTQENLLTDKILQSNFLGMFKNWIYSFSDNDSDIIKNAKDVRVIQSLTGRLLSNSEVTDNKDWYLDCLGGWLWIVGYEYDFEKNEINILTTQDPKTYEDLNKKVINL
jgi:hypothetical protein